jgi:serine/threonine-protein kinase
VKPHDRIGDYEILDVLGRGGMGHVYRVRNTISQRIEAMKVLRPAIVEDRTMADRFVREIKLLAVLHHPNIASLQTALSVGDQIVMLMELVDGESLAQRLRRGPLPVAAALDCIDQVLDALSYAHAKGVVHRDIKPANIMIAGDGRVKLTDFGIARSLDDATLTMSQATTGSVGYMAPEQLSGSPTDARSDVYSVGITLYELLTGQRPFHASTAAAVMVAQLQTAPRPPIELEPSIGAGLNAIILDAIARDPARRIQSAAAFRSALRGTTLAAGAGDGLADPTLVIAPPGGRPARHGDTTQRVGAAPSVESMVALPAAAPVPSGATRADPAAATPAGRPATSAVAGPEPHEATPAPASDASSVFAPAPASTLRAARPQSDQRQGHGVAVLAGLVAAFVALVAVSGAAIYLVQANKQPASPTGAATKPARRDLPSPSLPAKVDETKAADPQAGERAGVDGNGRTLAPAPTIGALEPSAKGGAAARTRAATKIAPTPAPAGVKAAPGTGPAADTATTSSTSVTRDPVVAEPRAPEPTVQQQARPAEDPRRLEVELDRLTARAAAADESLNRFRAGLARQGLSLRTDIASRHQSMGVNVAKAREALAQRNAERARQFSDLAAADVEAIEKFLGR